MSGGSRAGTHLKPSTAASAPPHNIDFVSPVSPSDHTASAVLMQTLNFRMEINYLRINTFSLEFVDVLLHL